VRARIDAAATTVRSDPMAARAAPPVIDLHGSGSGPCYKPSTRTVEVGMDDDALLERVQQLHAQGLSTNAITRLLGVSRARVAPLVRTLARERIQATSEPSIIGCWVSRGWSAGLAVPTGHDWPDGERHDAETSGLAGVLVAHEHPRVRGQVSACGYLVDTYCLGVKDALGPRTMGRNGLRRFVDLFFGGFDDAPVEAPVDLARHLVWGAVAYARGLGFEPHRDFGPAAGHLGQLDGPSAIGFGCDGKPYYIQGPRDDADRILRTLDANVGMDNVHFLVEAPMHVG
jgi:hypothetical protein